MSKIFEALRKTESESADVAKAVLSESTPVVTAGALGGAGVRIRSRQPRTHRKFSRIITGTFGR